MPERDSWATYTLQGNLNSDKLAAVFTGRGGDVELRQRFLWRAVAARLIRADFLVATFRLGEGFTYRPGEERSAEATRQVLHNNDHLAGFAGQVLGQQLILPDGRKREVNVAATSATGPVAADLVRGLADMGAEHIALMLNAPITVLGDEPLIDTYQGLPIEFAHVVVAAHDEHSDLEASKQVVGYLGEVASGSYVVDERGGKTPHADTAAHAMIYLDPVVALFNTPRQS